MSNLKALIGHVAGGAALTREEAREAFEIIMSGEATPAQIGGFLMALRVRGETVEEISAAAATMRAKALPVSAPADAVDVVGTGGDSSGSYNISTCSAFVVAGCGVPVAKHGNRSLSSRSGAADVLTALGVNINLAPEKISECIRGAGLGFMFAPNHHSAMKHVGPARTELGTRTVFNLLGPLTNPAGVRMQMVGVFAPQWVRPVAEVLRDLGATAAWVVHGAGGLDEISPIGPTMVAALKDGEITEFEVSPEDHGLPRSTAEALRGGEGPENAVALLGVLEGKPSAYRDAVLMNAGATLVVAGKAKDLGEGIELARQSIDSGAARARLEKLVAISNG
ncbi:anthranilate phosphoribosyltransferase [Stappia sp. F7233]|uniref:Anthranilate phosphoribosyltransferase n=1 Tax=Stappia albiluteola TaxID=2758565 RepID=A0A839AC81_9HYPH|nr:anthranilate phosphoribosyltransferase [Stappia albiluteola]MBA5776542.1 anthranilate phosphoribosyltransferase [Stappia albiluteola]